MARGVVVSPGYLTGVVDLQGDIQEPRDATSLGIEVAAPARLTFAPPHHPIRARHDLYRLRCAAHSAVASRGATAAGACSLRDNISAYDAP